MAASRHLGFFRAKKKYVSAYFPSSIQNFFPLVDRTPKNVRYKTHYFTCFPNGNQMEGRVCTVRVDIALSKSGNRSCDTTDGRLLHTWRVRSRWCGFQAPRGDLRFNSLPNELEIVQFRPEMTELWSKTCSRPSSAVVWTKPEVNRTSNGRDIDIRY